MAGEHRTVLVALLALGSSLSWGTADFLGGSVSRRLPVTTVLVVSGVGAISALLVGVTAAGGLIAPGRYLWWGVGAGLAGSLALGAFYRALADGTMGAVAPIAATGVVVPIVVGLATGDDPATLELVGIVAALVGIVLASSGEVRGAAGGVRTVLLSLVAAAGFGTFFVLMERGSQTSVGMTLIATRTAGLALALCAAAALRAPVRGWRPDVRTLVAVGVLDVLANGAFALAAVRGDLSVVSVLSSLYPVVTVLLARRVHDERLSLPQAAGVTASLAGVVLMAAG
jgi:drug/metabolite transporter (DMT)-like permease